MISVQSVSHARLEQLSASIISVHESPRVSVALSVENLVDAVSDLSFWGTLEAVSLPTTAASLWLSRWAEDDALVSAADVMPALLLFLSKDKTD